MTNALASVIQELVTQRDEAFAALAVEQGMRLKAEAAARDGGHAMTEAERAALVAEIAANLNIALPLRKAKSILAAIEPAIRADERGLVGAEDGRPYSADEFMHRLMQQWEKGEMDGNECMYAVKEWVHGDWPNATYGLSEVKP